MSLEKNTPPELLLFPDRSTKRRVGAWVIAIDSIDKLGEHLRESGIEPTDSFNTIARAKILQIADRDIDDITKSLRGPHKPNDDRTLTLSQMHLVRPLQKTGQNIEIVPDYHFLTALHYAAGGETTDTIESALAIQDVVADDRDAIVTYLHDHNVRQLELNAARTDLRDLFAKSYRDSRYWLDTYAQEAS